MNSVLQQQAKWYVKQVLDAIDCEDQMTGDESLLISSRLTKEEYADITTCFYLRMSFNNVERLTQECNKFVRDEVESLYNSYIQKYIDIVNGFYYRDYTKHTLTIGIEWLRTTLDDILELGDSKYYPKGFRCDSSYWDEEMFEDYLDSYSKDYYKVIANFIDTTMSELMDKINEQRELDGVI